jgi:predicted metal-dependent phosphoesterase TrpH
LRNDEKSIDLHTHSTRSDGTFTPSELVRYAAKKRLAAIAITDHDAVSGIDEAASAADETQVELVSGVELATAFNGTEIHIVGLFIDCHDGPFLKKLDDMSKRRAERNAAIFARLNGMGLYIEEADVFNDGVTGGRSATRANFARALVKRGYCETIKEGFERYLNRGRPAYVPREFRPPRDAIAAVRDAGGLSFLAHPILYGMPRDDVDSMAKNLKNDGLDGIEAIYSLNAPSDEAFFMKMAEKYNMLVTGGSDFHGANKATIDLGVGRGDLFVPASILSAIKSSMKTRKQEARG